MDSFNETLLMCQLREAYNNACVNGYQEEIDKMTDEQWAADLRDLDVYFEDLELHEIIEIIGRFRSK